MSGRMNVSALPVFPVAEAICAHFQQHTLTCKDYEAELSFFKRIAKVFAGKPCIPKSMEAALNLAIQAQRKVEKGGFLQDDARLGILHAMVMEVLMECPKVTSTTRSRSDTV